MQCWTWADALMYGILSLCSFLRHFSLKSLFIMIALFPIFWLVELPIQTLLEFKVRNFQRRHAARCYSRFFEFCSLCYLRWILRTFTPEYSSKVFLSKFAAMTMFKFRRFKYGSGNFGSFQPAKITHSSDSFRGYWVNALSFNQEVPGVAIFFIPGNLAGYASSYNYLEYVSIMLGEVQTEGIDNPICFVVDIDYNGPDAYLRVMNQIKSAYRYFLESYPLASTLIIGSGIGGTLACTLLLDIAKPILPAAQYQGDMSTDSSDESNGNILADSDNLNGAGAISRTIMEGGKDITEEFQNVPLDEQGNYYEDVDSKTNKPRSDSDAKAASSNRGAQPATASNHASPNHASSTRASSSSSHPSNPAASGNSDSGKAAHNGSGDSSSASNKGNNSDSDNSKDRNKNPLSVESGFQRNDSGSGNSTGNGNKTPDSVNFGNKQSNSSRENSAENESNNRDSTDTIRNGKGNNSPINDGENGNKHANGKSEDPGSNSRSSTKAGNDDSNPVKSTRNEKGNRSSHSRCPKSEGSSSSSDRQESDSHSGNGRNPSKSMNDEPDTPSSSNSGNEADDSNRGSEGEGNGEILSASSLEQVNDSEPSKPSDKETKGPSSVESANKESDSGPSAKDGSTANPSSTNTGNGNGNGNTSPVDSVNRENDSDSSKAKNDATNSSSTGRRNNPNSSNSTKNGNAGRERVANHGNDKGKGSRPGNAKDSVDSGNKRSESTPGDSLNNGKNPSSGNKGNVPGSSSFRSNGLNSSSPARNESSQPGSANDRNEPNRSPKDGGNGEPSFTDSLGQGSDAESSNSAKNGSGLSSNKSAEKGGEDLNSAKTGKDAAASRGSSVKNGDDANSGGSTDDGRNNQFSGNLDGQRNDSNSGNSGSNDRFPVNSGSKSRGRNFGSSSRNRNSAHSRVNSSRKRGHPKHDSAYNNGRNDGGSVPGTSVNDSRNKQGPENTIRSDGEIPRPAHSTSDSNNNGKYDSGPGISANEPASSSSGASANNESSRSSADRGKNDTGSIDSKGNTSVPNANGQDGGSNSSSFPQKEDTNSSSNTKNRSDSYSDDSINNISDVSHSNSAKNGTNNGISVNSDDKESNSSGTAGENGNNSLDSVNSGDKGNDLNRGSSRKDGSHREVDSIPSDPLNKGSSDTDSANIGINDPNPEGSINSAKNENGGSTPLNSAGNKGDLDHSSSVQNGSENSSPVDSVNQGSDLNTGDSGNVNAPSAVKEDGFGSGSGSGSDSCSANRNSRDDRNGPDSASDAKNRTNGSVESASEVNRASQDSTKDGGEDPRLVKPGHQSNHPNSKVTPDNGSNNHSLINSEDNGDKLIPGNTTPSMPIDGINDPAFDPMHTSMERAKTSTPTTTKSGRNIIMQRNVGGDGYGVDPVSTASPSAHHDNDQYHHNAQASSAELYLNYLLDQELKELYDDKDAHTNAEEIDAELKLLKQLRLDLATSGVQQQKEEESPPVEWSDARDSDSFQLRSPPSQSILGTQDLTDQEPVSYIPSQISIVVEDEETSMYRVNRTSVEVITQQESVLVSPRSHPTHKNADQGYVDHPADENLSGDTSNEPESINNQSSENNQDSTGEDRPSTVDLRSNEDTDGFFPSWSSIKFPFTNSHQPIDGPSDANLPNNSGVSESDGSEPKNFTTQSLPNKVSFPSTSNSSKAPRRMTARRHLRKRPPIELEKVVCKSILPPSGVPSAEEAIRKIEEDERQLLIVRKTRERVRALARAGKQFRISSLAPQIDEFSDDANNVVHATSLNADNSVSSEEERRVAATALRKPDGLLLISPFSEVKMKVKNMYPDLLTQKSLDVLAARLVQPGQEKEVWASPVSVTDGDWWDAALPEDGCVAMYGTSETVSGEVLRLVGSMQTANRPRTVTNACGNQLHAWPITNAYISHNARIQLMGPDKVGANIAKILGLGAFCKKRSANSG